MIVSYFVYFDILWSKIGFRLFYAIIAVSLRTFYTHTYSWYVYAIIY